MPILPPPLDPPLNSPNPNYVQIAHIKLEPPQGSSS